MYLKIKKIALAAENQMEFAIKQIHGKYSKISELGK